MKSFLFVLSGRNDSTAYTKFSYKIQNLTAFVYVFQKHFILFSLPFLLPSSHQVFCQF